MATRSWLEVYCEYAKNNEAAPQFHWWSGITAVAATLRRNVWYQRGYFTCVPSQMTLIVAASGQKKTTAVSIAYNLLSKLDHVKVLADRTTPEALAHSLSKTADEENDDEAQGLIYAPELSNFLDKKQHNEGMVQLILRLADSPERWVYKTKTGGITALNNVCLTFLGATANDLLYECVPALALKSGFLARFVCVVGGTEALLAVPFPWKDDNLESQALNGLYELSLLKGEMVMPDKVQKWFISWYMRHKVAAAKLASTKLRAYYERKPEHLVRLAMLVSIAVHRRLEFTEGCFEEALAKLEATEPGLEVLYNEIDSSGAGKEQTLILDYIKQAGPAGIVHSSLLAKVRSILADPEKFKRYLVLLVETRQIKVMRADAASKTLVYVYTGEKHV